MKKYNNIPIFIPELACPHQCVFCDQTKISGIQNIPQAKDVPDIVNQYLQTIPKKNHINIAFFGGSFTGIPFELQESYLKEAYKFVETKQVAGIRLSTRPDYINTEILDLLKKYGVETIELGAQSTDNYVLQKSGRGHTYNDIENASELINSYGFKLGLQMMIGLPGDTIEKSLQTTKDIINLGAENTRIYPTLVVKGTALEKMYHSGKYKVLQLGEAVEITKVVYKLFDENNVKIIRTGLHPSEELTYEKSLIAGPYHVSFKELVLTEIWADILDKRLKDINSESIVIQVNSTQLNYAVGFKSKNKNKLLKEYKVVKFEVNDSLQKFEINVSCY
ncbi:MAG: radical SAM protein [Bacteroidales bacterium]|nr:radical SAM protein [Bacteroidales bacterium]